MHPVDTLLIDFNPRQMVILNVAMAFLMFSVALDVRLADFRKVVDFPRSVGTGLVAQYLGFPLLTLAIIAAFQPPVSVALGMVLVSMCPSGNMTNFLVHFARANVALSVTLNAIIILSATIVTPAGFLFWSQFIPESAALRKSLQCVRSRARDIPDEAARQRFLREVPENARTLELARRRWGEEEVS